jgi:outer membrane pore protein E
MYSETCNLTPNSGIAVINHAATSVRGSLIISGFANKKQNVDVVAQYPFENGLRPSFGYIQSKGKDIERDYTHGA